MHAEVIAIGDELTSGQRLDTNSQWLSERLGDLGIRVLYHTTVGDDLAANVRVFREAFDRADILICTGGLGPTADDLTRQALADATGTQLVLDEGALAQIRALFARRKREMPERNVVQAMFPAGSSIVPNPHGSAPGIDMAVMRSGCAPCRVFALPGVPAEMQEMWEQTVAPRLLTAVGKPRAIRHYRVKCFGVGESDLEQMLPGLIERGRVPSVGITVSQATITLRITAEADDEAACRQLMQPTLNIIRECLGELIFGEEDEELQHAVIRLLRQRSARLAIAECGSGGLLGHWLSDVDPDGTTFVGGLVVRDLGDGSAIKLRELAERTRQQFAADHVVAIGPFPMSDSATNEPGVFHFGVLYPGGFITKSSPFAGHPEILRPRAIKQALNLLRLELLHESK